MYRQLITALMAAFCLFPNYAVASISVPPQQTWEQLYLAGENELDNRNFKKAERSLLAALVVTNGDTTKQFLTFDALEELYEEQRNYASSEKILLASLDLMRRQKGFPDAQCGAAYQKLAQADLVLGRLKAADEFAQAAVPIIKNTCGPQSVDTAVALNNLGWVECATEKLGLAETHFLQSLEIIRGAIGVKTVLYGMVANNLASAYIRTGNHQAALLWFKRSALALSESLGSDDSFAQDVTVRCCELQSAEQHKKHAATKDHMRILKKSKVLFNQVN
jgi:tetratricopeptide (TPR) repeat protein